VEHGLVDDDSPEAVEIISVLKGIAQSSTRQEDETGFFLGMAMHGSRMTIFDVQEPDRDMFIFKYQVFVTPWLEDNLITVILGLGLLGHAAMIEKLA
jgi:hypothetical protein